MSTFLRKHVKCGKSSFACPQLVEKGPHWPLFHHMPVEFLGPPSLSEWRKQPSKQGCGVCWQPWNKSSWFWSYHFPSLSSLWCGLWSTFKTQTSSLNFLDESSRCLLTWCLLTPAPDKIPTASKVSSVLWSFQHILFLSHFHTAPVLVSQCLRMQILVWLPRHKVLNWW